jgi:hypothetical protein
MDKATESNTIKRTDREMENRESKVKEWKPASSLPEFNQKAGWSYRWVRVKHSEHPEIQLAADPNSQYKDGIEIGGVLLCKIPTELMEQRQAYVDKATRQQTEAVDAQYMNQNDPRMPKFAEGQETGSTKFGKGSK